MHYYLLQLFKAIALKLSRFDFAPLRHGQTSVESRRAHDYRTDVFVPSCPASAACVQKMVFVAEQTFAFKVPPRFDVVFRFENKVTNHFALVRELGVSVGKQSQKMQKHLFRSAWHCLLLKHNLTSPAQALLCQKHTRQCQAKLPGSTYAHNCFSSACAWCCAFFSSSTPEADVSQTARHLQSDTCRESW